MSNFPCSLTRNITLHTMENLAFHSLLRWNIIVLPILTTSLVHLSLKGWENVFHKHGNERVNPFTPRVVNFEFALRPHLKYYLIQYKDLGFS